MKRLSVLLAFACMTPASAETVIAAKTLRAYTLITAHDVIAKDTDVPGAVTSMHDVIGQETRVAIYAGRPIRPSDVGPPAIVERNQIVTLIFNKNGLTILSEGRSLSRGGIGDQVRVMNTSSRSNLFGTVAQDGSVLISN